MLAAELRVIIIPLQDFPSEYNRVEIVNAWYNYPKLLTTTGGE